MPRFLWTDYLRKYFTRVLYESKSAGNLIFFFVEAKSIERQTARACRNVWAYVFPLSCRPHGRGVVPLVTLLTDGRRVFAFRCLLSYR